MHLLIVEGHPVEAEFRRKFGAAHTYDFCPAAAPDLLTRLGAADVAFDLRDWPELHYEQPRQPLFYQTTTRSLARLFHGEAPPFGPVFGFCGLPTFLDVPVWEVSSYRPAELPQLTAVCARLGLTHQVVQDRVGLLTPRIVCLSINEACHALQEGVVDTVQAADLLLGNGGPGLLARANAIGVSRVYETLEAAYQDTHELRYNPCALLKRMHLRGQQFKLVGK